MLLVDNVIAKIEIGSWGIENEHINHLERRKIIVMEEGSIVLREEYNLNPARERTIAISRNEIAKIKDYIEKIYESNEDTHTDGDDGECYKITVMMPGKDIFETEEGYIYGTETLEPFVDYVCRLINNDE